MGIFKTVYKNPWTVPLAAIHRIYRTTGLDNAISVMDENWDNLIILDACRFDLFRLCWEGPGELSSVTSKGSNTPEWLTRSFPNKYPDTVYVTGNPQVQANDIARKFHDHVPVWESDWDNEYETVLPADMADATIDAISSFDNKRVISHWIQPHYPFIGETGTAINQGSLTGGGVRQESMDEPSIWEQMEQGEVAEDKVWQAYKENLELVLPEVYRTLEEIDGRTVVTSDHGNAFGRFGLYGHPGSKFIKDLVNVPWVVVDGNRRDIFSEDIQGEKEVSKLVEDRLRDLGYR